MTFPWGLLRAIDGGLSPRRDSVIRIHQFQASTPRCSSARRLWVDTDSTQRSSRPARSWESHARSSSKARTYVVCWISLMIFSALFISPICVCCRKWCTNR
jgi:hypothetical protein